MFKGREERKRRGTDERERQTRETWQDYEKKLAEKRAGKTTAKKPEKIPNDILVQRMSSTPSGRLKKFEPLDTRDFVPFGEFDELTIQNIKEACEIYYKEPEGSCDILASDRGPSCTKIEQLKGKKVYFIRFLSPEVGRSHSAADSSACAAGLTGSMEGERRQARGRGSTLASSHFSSHSFEKRARLQESSFPKSISIANILKAGKLVKPKVVNSTVLEVENFNLESMQWDKPISLEIDIEDEDFDSGAFRKAYKGFEKGSVCPTWVVKKYKDEAVETIKTYFGMSPEDHARKHVQMHAVARSITQRFAKSAPKEFGEVFTYNKVYFSKYKESAITIEPYVEGQFKKYINNDGNSCIGMLQSEEDGELLDKAKCLVHYSFVISGEKLMLLDIQGAGYNLYDPEIASETLCYDEAGPNKEMNFCVGNLSSTAIEEFTSSHICNRYCDMMDLHDFPREDAEKKNDNSN